jgi:hypothetical protein
MQNNLAPERVSVVIPAYNAAVHLPATLASIAEQSFKPLEIIVVDDGSRDDTVRIAQAHGVHVISIPNGGPSAARNAGTEAARGEFVAYLDADDLWAPDKLALQLAAHRTFGQPAFSFTDYRLFDERGVHSRSSELLHHWAFRRVVAPRGRVDRGEIVITAGDEKPVLYDSYIPPSSVLVRRADALAVGGFDETLRVAEDFEFYLRLLKRVPAIAVMKPLMLYRRHLQQATSNGVAMKSGLLDVAARVAAAPDRYPGADARYISQSAHLRYHWLGMEHARRAELDAAVARFEQSLAARWTPQAGLALTAARICRSGPANAAFTTVRAVWKKRPKRR